MPCSLALLILPEVHFPSITFRTLHGLSFVPSSHLFKKKQNKTVSLDSLMLVGTVTLLALVFCLGVHSGSYSWIYGLLSFINFGKFLSIISSDISSARSLALLLGFVTCTWTFDVALVFLSLCAASVWVISIALCLPVY